MRNLALTTILFGAALSATGCIIVDDDDDDRPRGGVDLGDYGTELRTSWKLVSGQNDDSTPTEAAFCQPGRNAAATLYTCPGTPATCTNPAEDAFVDIGNCNSNQSDGRVDVPYADDPRLSLPPGHYTVWYEFSAGGRVYAKSFTQEVDLDAGGTESLDFEVQVGHGFFDVAWTLVDDATTVRCADVPTADAVVLDVSPLGGGPEDIRSSPWDCVDGLGRSYAQPFNAAGFSNRLFLTDASEEVQLGSSEDMPSDDFAFGNEAIDLGTVAIEVE